MTDTPADPTPKEPKAVKDILLPDCVRGTFTIYVLSPSTGLEAAVALSGWRSADTDKLPQDVRAACDTLNCMSRVSDARAMTVEEVADYLRREEVDGEDEECDD